MCCLENSRHTTWSLIIVQKHMIQLMKNFGQKEKNWEIQKFI